MNLFVVEDQPGKELADSIRSVIKLSARDGNDLWGDVLGSSRQLLWRTVFWPLPSELNEEVQTKSNDVLIEIEKLDGAVGPTGRLALEALRGSVELVARSNPVVGKYLLESITEIGVDDCVVVADSRRSRLSLMEWLAPYGVRVLTSSMLAGRVSSDAALFVPGPPKMNKTALVTAPISGEVTFVFPSWFKDHSLPNSAVSDRAEGAVKPSTITHNIPETSHTSLPAVKVDEPNTESIEELLPEPVWGFPTLNRARPAEDGVRVRKILLSGGYGMWLDTGERIRALDPRQAAGERVVYREVSGVGVGTYLLARVGQTDRFALLEDALSSLGERRDEVVNSQDAWKGALQSTILSSSRTAVESQLRAQGIKSADRVEAWCDPTLVRPNSDRDFRRLLEWLRLPTEATVQNANALRKARSRSIVQIREQLENGLSSTDMSELLRVGHVLVKGQQFADMVATRVLACSTTTTIVPRHEARLLFRDSGSRWLE